MMALLVTAAVLLASCAPASQTPSSSSAPQSTAQPSVARTKTITIGITSPVQAIGVVQNSPQAGGWLSLTEIHSNGLVTSDVHGHNPIGRLAERVPSLEDKTVTLLPDGQMRVAFTLRRNVFWHDGTPFTAQDLVFSYRVQSDAGMPLAIGEAVREMRSAEAPDDQTFVALYRAPYFQGSTPGPFTFWPLPRHILEPAYERYLASGNPDEFVNLPYWTTNYVHLGPFRLTQFDPSLGLVFEAHDRYFLGRPKVDVVRVQPFTDFNGLLANALAGSVDLIPPIALGGEQGEQLKQRWTASNDGTVIVRGGSPWILQPQFRPAIQTEAANLDPRVRAALYHALDREAASDATNGGHRELAAWSLLPPEDEFFEATRDGLRSFVYDPGRAQAMLQDAGWSPASDGLLRHSGDARRFQTAIWSQAGRDREVAVFADYWRRVGLEVDEYIIPAALVRNAEYRAQFPAWEASGSGFGYQTTVKMEGPAASAQNRWSGNRAGYDDPRASQLVTAFRASPSVQEQLRAMRAINDFFRAELPFLQIYFLADYLAVRKGVHAFDDTDGGQPNPAAYGSDTRNAHLWDLTE